MRRRRPIGKQLKRMVHQAADASRQEITRCGYYVFKATASPDWIYMQRCRLQHGHPGGPGGGHELSTGHTITREEHDRITGGRFTDQLPKRAEGWTMKREG